MRTVVLYEKVAGKRGVRVEVDGGYLCLLTMRNGYQWAGMPMDRELMEFTRDAINEALAKLPELNEEAE